MRKTSLTEDQKEIIDRIPDLTSRIGIIFLASITLILFLLSLFIEYPDTLSGEATLNTEKPAVKVVMPSDGNLTLVKAPKTVVKKGELIAIVKNAANYQDVLSVKKTLQEFYNIRYDTLYRRLPTHAQLGELNPVYNQFVNSDYYKQGIINSNRQIITTSITDLEYQSKSKEWIAVVKLKKTDENGLNPMFETKRIRIKSKFTTGKVSLTPQKEWENPLGFKITEYEYIK